VARSHARGVAFPTEKMVSGSGGHGGWLLGSTRAALAHAFVQEPGVGISVSRTLFDGLVGDSWLRPSAMVGYLASYYDVNSQKVGERIVTSDEQIAYLFHIVPEYVR
jgi:hypothetical protein